MRLNVQVYTFIFGGLMCVTINGKDRGTPRVEFQDTHMGRPRFSSAGTVIIACSTPLGNHGFVRSHR